MRRSVGMAEQAAREEMDRQRERVIVPPAAGGSGSGSGFGGGGGGGGGAGRGGVVYTHQADIKQTPYVSVPFHFLLFHFLLFLLLYLAHSPKRPKRSGGRELTWSR